VDYHSKDQKVDQIPLLQVYVVDDDESVRKALKRLITFSGMQADVFGSIEEFIGCGFEDKPGCLVLDVHMLGGTGFDLKAHLDASAIEMPVIFITAHDSEETRRRAKEAGAKSYLEKPFDDKALLDAISDALADK
jgi:FixJ family two-component response regulator